MASLFSTPTSTSYLFREKSSLYGAVLPLRSDRKPRNLRSSGVFEISCRLSTRAKESSSSSPALNPDSLIKEPHKYFDQVVITVRSGDGGHGAVLNMPNQRPAKPPQGKVEKEKARRRGLLKRDFGGSLILPTGGHGGDVVIYSDEEEDTLLKFHNKGRYNAKRGGNVAAMGVLTSQLRDGLAAPTLRIAMPVGTVVKRKRGTLLRDLAQPGDEILVARGGQGGMSLVEMPERSKKMLMALTTNVMRDDSDKVLSLGQPGEEVTLELILRVVADVGLVGLPNAGKSTLLAATTLAKPDIADYPFTTLMPNLGRLNGDPSLGAQMYTSEATLADLPGLIEGAHLGKGLGRNFLRHLRRTRLLVHVVDAAAEDPVNDYRTVKQELRMYNPDYLERPYIVVLNKIDIPKASERLPSLTEEIMRLGSDRPSTSDTTQPLPTEGENPDVPSSGVRSRDRKEKGIEDYPRPIAIVGVSVLAHRGNEFVFQVTRSGENGSKHAVDLGLHTCTCRRWQLSGIPCVHAICAIRFKKQDACLYCDDYLMPSSYMQTYTPTIFPIAGEDDWEEVDYPIAPPPYKNQTGRPKLKRNKEAREKNKTTAPPAPIEGKLGRKGTKMTCKICGQLGHNKLGCPITKAKKAAATGGSKSSNTTKRVRNQVRRAPAPRNVASNVKDQIIRSRKGWLKRKVAEASTSNAGASTSAQAQGPLTQTSQNPAARGASKN